MAIWRMRDRSKGLGTSGKRGRGGKDEEDGAIRLPVSSLNERKGQERIWEKLALILRGGVLLRHGRGSLSFIRG